MESASAIEPQTTTAAAAAAVAIMRRIRVRLMSGDEVEFEIDAAKRVRDLKQAIAGCHALDTPPAARQRLVLMPPHGGKEPHEVLADARLLAQCGTSDDTELELVILDAPEDVPCISRVASRSCLFSSSFFFLSHTQGVAGGSKSLIAMARL